MQVHIVHIMPFRYDFVPVHSQTIKGQRNCLWTNHWRHRHLWEHQSNSNNWYHCMHTANICPSHTEYNFLKKWRETILFFLNFMLVVKIWIFYKYVIGKHISPEIQDHSKSIIKVRICICTFWVGFSATVSWCPGPKVP